MSVTTFLVYPSLCLAVPVTLLLLLTPVLLSYFAAIYGYSSSVSTLFVSRNARRLFYVVLG